MWATSLRLGATRERVRVTTMLCALSIKPLEGSRSCLPRTRSIVITIDRESEAIANKVVTRETWLLMLVNVLLAAFKPGEGTP